MVDAWLDPGESWATDPGSGRSAHANPTLEASLSRDLTHPNLVQTYCFAFKRDEASRRSRAVVNGPCRGAGRRRCRRHLHSARGMRQA